MTNSNGKTEYWSAQYSSPVGRLTLASDGDGLTGLWLEGQKYFASTACGTMAPREDLPVFSQTREWLDRYFAREQPNPRQLPLTPAGSPFRQAVWQLLLEIPYGRVTTYSALAKQLSPKSSARAVGGAVGRNPISIIIPCHRVVGSDGSLTGYAGGMERKIWLLKHEGLETGATKRVYPFSPFPTL